MPSEKPTGMRKLTVSEARAFMERMYGKRSWKTQMESTRFWVRLGMKERAAKRASSVVRRLRGGK